MKETHKISGDKPDVTPTPGVYRIKRGVTLSMVTAIASLVTVTVTILLAPPWYHRQAGSAPDIAVSSLPTDESAQPTDESAPPFTPFPSSSPAASTSLFTEQEFNHAGAPTFSNPTDASGPGPQIPYLAEVQVSCKVYDPAVPSVNPDGYWYRIASPSWHDTYYAAANTFLNGDPPNGPYTHNTDFRVPDC